MAIKINFPVEKKVCRTFSDIKQGEMFMYGNETLYYKLCDFYTAEDIRYEVDNEHEIYNAEDIDSDYYNCVNVSTGAFLYLPNWANIQKVNVEINVSKVN
jgi:hypothetical protein